MQFCWTLLNHAKKGKNGFVTSHKKGSASLGLLLCRGFVAIAPSEFSAFPQAFCSWERELSCDLLFQPDRNVIAGNSPELLSYSWLFSLPLGGIWGLLPAVKFRTKQQKQPVPVGCSYLWAAMVRRMTTHSYSWYLGAFCLVLVWFLFHIISYWNFQVFGVLIWLCLSQAASSHQVTWRHNVIELLPFQLPLKRGWSGWVCVFGFCLIGQLRRKKNALFWLGWLVYLGRTGALSSRRLRELETWGKYFLYQRVVAYYPIVKALV